MKIYIVLFYMYNLNICFLTEAWWCSHCLLFDTSTSSCCHMLLAKGALGLVWPGLCSWELLPMFLVSLLPKLGISLQFMWTWPPKPNTGRLMKADLWVQPWFMLLMLLSFLCSGIHCVWRQWCFILILKVFKNTKSVLYKFLHCTTSISYPNIPLACHLNYIPCSLGQLNAFVKVLILGFCLHLPSILLFACFLWLYFLSDA